ncbi:MAG: YrdB family protein [Anaerolineales bacterium]|jgi:membrane protein YdbS with pleckstrin-like domain
MGSHPINLAIRFLLELSALVSMGVWGWRQSESWFRFLLALSVPIVAAVVWGTFAVPNDPSRSGAAPVAVPGILRLGIELAFFIFATWALYDLGFTRLSWTLGIIVALHYIISYDRILWLITQ